MRFVVPAVVIAACAVLVSAYPARASITAASISTKSSKITGACPKTVDFMGSITGTAATTFIYSFNRYINGAQHVVSMGAGTIPSSGSFPVSDSITITAAASGTTFDQIWVHNISGGQSDVYSNEAHFSVTCSVPPRPTPKPTPKPKPLPYPTHLKNTVDAQTCGVHGGYAALFCNSALHAGYLVLVWDFKNEGRISGYHVYETGIAIYEHVATVNNPQTTIAFLKPESKGGFGGLCYIVKAYKGSEESRQSNTFCVPEKYKYAGPPAPTRVLELNPTISVCRWHHYLFSGAFDTYAGGAPPLDCSPIEIGYAHTDVGGGLSLHHENADYQTALVFDQSAIKGLRVFKASLELTLPKKGGGLNCYGSIGMVTTPFAANGGDWIPGDFSTFPTQAHFKNHSRPWVDVTGIVKAWATGKTANNGFVTRSSDENFGTEENNGWCFLNFENNAVLRIEHF